MILGICGPIASGKTSTAQKIQKEQKVLFQNTSLSFPKASICEGDLLGKAAWKIPSVSQKISDFFSLPLPQGFLRYQKELFSFQQQVRKKVYENPEKIYFLEQILHPHIKNFLQKEIASTLSQKKNMIVVCALPQQFCLRDFCDKMLHLTIGKEEAWKRIQKRNPDMPKHFFLFLWNRQQQKEYSGTNYSV
jgi:dephospho-CoA kinase